MLIMFLLMSSILFLINKPFARATTWIVDDDGPADFHTIQEAINAAWDGDTIFVKSGTYYEGVVVNKTVSLIGENVETTILNGQDSAATISITADNAHVSGFSVTSTSTGVLLRSSGCVFSGNDIASNGEYGISIDWGFSSNNVLTGNTITGSRYGICFNDDYNGCWFCNNTITENRLSDNANAGIVFFGSYSMGDSSYNVISGNALENSTVGIQMMWGWFNTVLKNQIVSSEDGMCFVVNRYSTISENSIAAVNGDGVRLQGDWGYHMAYDCSCVAISGNKVTVENGNGVAISGCFNNTVSENDIATTNGSCVYLFPYRNYDYGTYEDYPSTCNLVSQNNLTSTDQNCIRVINSSSNVIYHNNLFAQHTSLVNSENSENLWDNGYPSGGNYWSDYAGEDLCYGVNQSEIGSDGIGDSAYVIDANNIDNYPLMRPYVPFENQTIYIRADGSVDPSGAPILRNGDFYSLKNSITSNDDGIVLERDNMVIDGAGYTLQGARVDFSSGIDLTERTNVTIQNTQIRDFHYGIWLSSSYSNIVRESKITNNMYSGIFVRDYSSSNIVSGNEITNSGSHGIYIYYHSFNNIVSGNSIMNNTSGVSLAIAFSNSVSGNYIADSSEYGIASLSSYNNTVSGNSVTANGIYGIALFSSGNNTVSGNNITANNCGVYIFTSSGNKFFHNNFMHNFEQSAVWELGDANTWDDGYPSGGNYWSDQNPQDIFRGSYQNVTGSDGIGDIPYATDADNVDRYPLIFPVGYVPIPDFNHDGIINILDLVKIALAYGSVPGMTIWNPYVDLNQDSKINILDIVVIAINFGKQWPPP
jgi:parallel beta-helix repeat protein